MAMPLFLVLVAFGWLVLAPHFWFLGYEPREGDVLFQSLPRTSLTMAIEGATDSPWSHCGIVAYEDGQWMVYEAYGSVQRVPLSKFWQRSRANQFAVYRLKPEHQPQVPHLLECVRAFLGRPYDVRYEMDEEKIYCSELIFKAWRDAGGADMGRLVTLGDLNWEPFERTIRAIERGPVPLDRVMITPHHLSQAQQLELVRRYGD